MPSVTRIAIRTLHENARVAETFGEHFTAYVVQSNAFANVSPRLLHDLIAVHVWQQTETEALWVRWVGEAIDGDGWLRSMEGLANS